ncbi:MAG: FtsX-like permease family protein [Chthoniobacterales bacterium]
MSAAIARRTPLAWRNLIHSKVTLFVSSTAVAFAVLIMFMELGFLNGLYDSQTGALQFLNADLVMVSRSLHILNTHETFPLVRLKEIGGLRGVKAAYPIYTEDTASELRNPANGIKNGIRVLAFDPDDPVFERRALNQMIGRLRTHLTILFDRQSRTFFGPLKDGMTTELADRAVTVVGTFDLGPDYYFDGNVLTSIDTFFSLFPFRKRGDVFIGVVQLERGASADDVLEQIDALHAADVEVFKKADIVAREKATWQKTTPAGYIFTMGVAVGFIIGIFICYQILYTDIADHLPQLATMKALGYHNRDLVQLVLTEAILLGVIGFIPALFMTFGLYSILAALTGIVTQLTVTRVALVLALTIGMCFVSGLLAVRKALAVDPAELF